jgi:hypothetical protein
MADVPATWRERRQQAMPPENMHPVRVVSQAESRVGLLTVRRRRLTARGVQPVGAVPHLLAWLSVYGAVAPTPGERCFLERPYRNAESFQLCINACAQAVADSLNILLLDHSGAHTAQRLTIPANVRLLCWPPLLSGAEPHRTGVARPARRPRLAAVQPCNSAARLWRPIVAGRRRSHAALAQRRRLLRECDGCTIPIAKSYDRPVDRVMRMTLGRAHDGSVCQSIDSSLRRVSRFSASLWTGFAQ